LNNDYLNAVILGIVEGLTEFLPISSTAHLRVVQVLLGQDTADEYGKMFAVVIQLGAILAVVAYFRERLIGFVRSYPQGTDGSKSWLGHPLALVLMSFLVTAIPCFIIDKQIGENLENMWVIGWSLVIGGIVMALVDLQFSSRAKTRDLEQMTPWQGVLIGLAQILAAAFPGTSRSMSTIAAGQVLGLSRAAALEFSFFLSIPVMFAATGYKLLKFLLSGELAPRVGIGTGLTTHQWGTLSIGFIVSFVVALGVIAWFMDWVRQRGFLAFAAYRIIVGTAVILWLAQ
jgi:undecaprenyl-diphosphatase